MPAQTAPVPGLYANTPARYGLVARGFHWLIALMMLAAVALGLVMTALPTDSVAAIERTLRLYSLHKTLGVAIFAVAVLRIVWALTQPKPGLLHPERRAESFAAEAVHWALYGALVVMPLSGWIYHAALDGYAPILWPFGQDLPFVPKSEVLAHVADAVHKAAAWVIYATVGLHVAGALKHALIDRDGTLARMTRGAAPELPPQPAHSLLPPLAALVLWAGVIGLGLLAPTDTAPPAPATAAPAATPGTAAHPWTVSEGTIGIGFAQMGARAQGSFTGWTAAIDYDDIAGTGHVTVTIPVTGLTLGSVTSQALGPVFFDAAGHPTATFDADIDTVDGQTVATGTLDLRGQTVPVILPFTLKIEGDTARMQGATTLDRRDFGMGAGYQDEKTVGFAVEVQIALTATRS